MRVLFRRAEDSYQGQGAFAHFTHIILRRREASHYTDAATPIRLWWAMPSWRRGKWEQQSCSSSPQQNMAHISMILQCLAFNCCIEAVAGARKTCDCCTPGTQEMTDMTRDDKGMQRGSTLADIARAAAIERLCDRVSIGPVLCHACREIRCLSSIGHPSIVLCYLFLTDIQAMRQMIWQMWPLLAWPAAQRWAGTTEM